MSFAHAPSAATRHLPGWAPASRFPGRQSSGLLLVLTFHCLALWLVLSGRGPQAPKVALPPIIAQILPSPESPAPKSRTLPAKAVTREYSISKPLVPEPEENTPTSSDTPMLESRTTTDAPVQMPNQPVTAGPSDSAGARGFGSITNRAACGAAFQQSYPREARRASQEGTVTVSVRVGPDGKVQSAEVVNSNPRRVFDRAAISVINSGACVFETDTAGYQAVLEVSYKLSGESAD